MIKISAFCDEAAEDLSGQIAALQENGICFADIRNIDGKNVADFTERDCALYAAEFRRAGIGISCIGSPLGKSQLSGDFSAVCGMAESLCRTAIAFKTDKIRIFSFYGAKGQFEAVADRLKALVSIAQKYGVTLLHENELGIYGERAEDVLRLSGIEGLGFVYDPANYVLAGDPIQEAERTVFLSKYIHIKDARYSGEIVPAGEGDGNLRELLLCDRNQTLTLEPHLVEFGGYAGLTDRELKHSAVYDSPRSAFQAASNALRRLLSDLGYQETKEGWLGSRI